MNTGWKPRQRIVGFQLITMIVGAVLCSCLTAWAFSWASWLGDDDLADGGSGTWNHTSTNWYDQTLHIYTNWTDGVNKTKFAGSGGVVRVDGSVDFYQLLYIYTNYVFTNGIISGSNGFALYPGDGATVTVYSAFNVPGSPGNIGMQGALGQGTVVLNSDLTADRFHGSILFYAGTLVLNGNVYSSGTVYQNGTGQYGRVYLNGTHYGTAGYTVREDGGLGGTGTVQLASSGSKVAMYGKLTPGTATQIGTFTASVGDFQFYPSAHAEFQVDLTSATADKLVVGHQLTYNGALDVHVTGTRTTAVSNQLFQFGSKTGSFVSTNVFGVDPTKATISFSEATGVLTYVPLPAKGTVTMVR